MKSLVLTLIGSDRSGLIEILSNVIASHQGNWVESRMAHLSGQFAGLLRVEVPDSALSALSSDLRDLESQGLQVMLLEGSAPEEAQYSQFELEVVGSDRPGIIQRFSKVLSEASVSIELLDTECDGAPWSGGSLFRAYARLRLPTDLTIASLRKSLEAIAADLMVDVTVHDEA